VSDSLVKIPDQWLPLEGDFFAKDAYVLARELLGCHLLVKKDDVWIGGPICETEAYTQDDPASHSYRGESLRNRSMFQEAGTIYVYLIYGMHFCLNFSSGAFGRGDAVLIRAMEPLFGASVMNRGSSAKRAKICSGPGRLCAALGIDRSFDGQKVGESALSVWRDPERHPPIRVFNGPRIGISKGLDRHWRFGIPGHPSLSRP
jgi:DNA-3-methyladenine glycosylase